MNILINLTFDPKWFLLKSVSKRYAVFLASMCEPGSREFISNYADLALA